MKKFVVVLYSYIDKVMVNKKQLMFGDYVFYKDFRDKVFQVYEIFENCVMLKLNGEICHIAYYNELFPVEITEDILIQLEFADFYDVQGIVFYKEKDRKKQKIYMLEEGKKVIIIDLNKKIGNFMDTNNDDFLEFNNFKIEHLHKLQHLFNEFLPDKEIKIQL